MKSLRALALLGLAWLAICPVVSAAPQNQPDDQTELYHLATDKSEERNLAESEKGRVETMRKKLDAWWPGKL